MIKHLTFLAQLLCLLFLFNHSLQAQVPQVPERLHFAGMDLQLNDQARRDIQSSVDALYRSEKHFNIMLEKVDLYMPVIEPILLEYGVPQEFKYLVIQESALIPDAVSSSNAVGFWQFKESSATELGLRVDRQVDERMNIISSTEGAAKYLLRSNAEFDNWLYTLQSYMVGQGGTSRSVDKKFYGARKMKIDGNTHWYIKKFLSHLVAFENAIGKQTRPTILYKYSNTHNKSLSQIAHEFDTDEEQLQAYNKWLKAARIPEDKTYTVIVPLRIADSEGLLAKTEDRSEKSSDKQNEHQPFGHKQQQPEKPAQAAAGKLVVVEMNDLKGIVAREGDNVRSLAEVAKLSESRFRKFNDLGPREAIQAGQFYYLEKKHRRARVYEHVLQPGESLWDVAQRYGLRLDKLLQKNRMSSQEKARPGRVLWLRFIRPRRKEVEYRPVKEPKEPLYASTQKPGEAPLQVTPPTERVEIKKDTEQATPLPINNPPAAAEEIEEEEGMDPAPVPLAKAEPDTLERKVIYPADTPVSKPVYTAENSAQLKDVQKDTLNRQSETRDILQENKEKSLYPEENLPEQAEAASDSFSVDSPVIFVESEEEIPQTEEERLHVVEAGETLYALSRKYGASVEDLIEWNQLSSQPVLSIGQQIRVAPPSGTTSPSSPAAPIQQTEETEESQEQPAQSEVKASYRYHEVSAGESMYRVARMYNVTIKDIMEWNNKENFDIREGERLIVGTEDM